MARIRIDYLKPGMVLAEDLKHTNGRFLLGKGLRLEETHLRMLKMWGISAAEIEGENEDFKPPTEEQINPEMLQVAEKSIQKRFSHADLKHPFFQELFRLCSLRRAQKMAQQEAMGNAKIIHEEEGVPSSVSRSVPAPSNHKENLYALVDEDIGLASLPNIFFEISKVINDPRSSAVHLADVISKDTSFSAKLLKIVNSAFYGFPSKIDTISRAVIILGSKQLSTLALGTSVISIFRDIPSGLVSMKSFWEHSIACGISARMIASYRNFSNSERLFVAGLLHDIGKIIIYKHLPRKGKEILFLAKQTNRFLRSTEFEILGFDHTQIAGILFKKWKLPLILEHAVKYHHTPLLSQYPLESSIVYLADILAISLELGTSGESFVPPLLPEVWEQLGLQPEIFTKITQLIDRQVQEIVHNFFDA